jgi:hypothetical protein
MHRLQSTSSVFRFRCCSLLLWLAALSFSAGAAVMVLGFYHSNDAQVLTGGEIMGGGLLAYLIEWLLSARARCPLCMISPLHPKGCQKNRRVKRLFGSYRLRVATNVLFRDFFQCPYCGEATKIAVRERMQPGRIDSSQSASEGLRKR